MFDRAAAGAAQVQSIRIRRPDDWHVHLRDGAMLAAVLPFTVAQFARGIIMPNLVPPVTTVAAASAYRDRILAARPAGSDFQPLMTCYLTDATSPDEIARGHAEGVWVAAKLYPAGATTNARYGVTDIAALAPVLERMERIGMPVLIHGEATDPAIDIFDREAAFMEQSLLPLLKRHQGLKVVIEHATTAETWTSCAPMRRAWRDDHAAPSGHQPHLAVSGRVAAASLLPAGGQARAAPAGAAQGRDLGRGLLLHRHRHRAAPARAQGGGVLLRPASSAARPALQTYVQVFDEENALDRFEAFASVNGARFYGLEPNRGTLVLERAKAAPWRRLRSRMTRWWCSGGACPAVVDWCRHAIGSRGMAAAGLT